MRFPAIGMVAVVLVGGTSLVTAQTEPGSPGMRSGPAASAVPAQKTVGLSSEQKQLIWQNLGMQQGQPAPSDFQPMVGSRLPSSVTLNDPPAILNAEIPQIAEFKLAKIEDKVLVVDPGDRAVLEVIDRQAQ